MAGPVANWTCLLRSIDRRVPYRHLGDHAGDLGEQGSGNRFLPVAGICDATGEAHRSDCGNDHGPHGFSPIALLGLRPSGALPDYAS
jgi:hypothetical protein